MGYQKNKETVLLLLFIVSVFNSSLGQENKISSLQKKVDQFYPQTPDSSIIYLKSLSKFIPQNKDSLRIATYTKIGLTYGQLQNKDSANTYFQKATLASSNHPILIGKTYQSWGKVNRDFGDYERGMEVLNIADSIFKEHWYSPGIGMVLVEKATINHYTQNIKESIEQLKDAIRILESIDDKEHLLIAKMELAASFLMNDNYEFAKNLYADILPQLEVEKGLNYYFTLVNYGDCFYQLEEYNEARKKYEISYDYFKAQAFKKYEYYILSKIAEANYGLHNYTLAEKQFHTSFWAMEEMSSPRLQQVSSSYLRVLNYKKKTPEALQVLQAVLNKSEDHKTKLNTNNDLYFLKEAIETYKQNGDFEKGLIASERLMYLSDSLKQVKNKARVKEIEAKYQNKYHRQNNKLLKAKNDLLVKKSTNKKWIIGLLTIVLTLLAALTMMTYLKAKEKIRLQGEKVRELNRKREALEERRKLQLELDKKRNELLNTKNREMVSLSMQLADGAKEIRSILRKSSSKDLPSRIRLQLQQLINKRNYWDLFNKKFTEIHPEFELLIERTFPQFTKADIEFCKLLKLNLENKEIATLLGISHQSVITKKYRLNKKLNTSEEVKLLGELLK